MEEVDFVKSPSCYKNSNETGALPANPPWKDDTFTGANGAGSLANAEKVAAWLQSANREKMGHVEEIIYQHSERVKK